MDLTQSKLSKKEWETIEVPVSDAEKQILAMIKKGYDDIFFIDDSQKNIAAVQQLEKKYPEVKFRIQLAKL